MPITEYWISNTECRSYSFFNDRSCISAMQQHTTDNWLPEWVLTRWAGKVICGISAICGRLLWLYSWIRSSWCAPLCQPCCPGGSLLLGCLWTIWLDD